MRSFVLWFFFLVDIAHLPHLTMVFDRHQILCVFSGGWPGLACVGSGSGAVMRYYFSFTRSTYLVCFFLAL